MAHVITDKFKLALAQLNAVVGDIEGNLKKARDARARAAEAGADLIAFTELYLTGYPIEDLVLKPALQKAAREACEALARDTEDGGPAVLVGLPWGEAPFVHNAVALLDRRRIEAVRYKYNLPNYGVFDEKRVFAPGPLPQPIEFRGVKIGVPVCEDIWSEEACEALAQGGAKLLIVPNGSPYWMDKQKVRYGIAETRVAETRLPLAYVNQVGGQDELVFDGASFVLNEDATLAVQLPAWEEALGITEWQHEEGRWRCLPGAIAEIEEGEAANYGACVTGLRDYVEKNGFPGVVLGLSGGIDSALCAVMAVDALGAKRVHGVMLPYLYTSNESLNDAAATAEALGIRYDIMPIDEAVEGLTKGLEKMFDGATPDATEENLQSRARGALLMAISNKFGPIVLTTGNKSEVSVGYATLYGDMNGGFNPIKDLYKGQVYALARYRNAARPKGCLGPQGVVIPENVLTKAPTAELKPGQRDQDTLPPYEVLDDILNCLVELEMPLPEIVARGHSPEVVRKVERMLYLAEYKRRQAAPGVKITAKNFGRDRRYPITNKFREKLSVTVRFAPSPTGRLHAGNIRTALFNFLFARKVGGRFLLRLDDTDRERSTEEFARGIREDLAWLGLAWTQEVRQSDRFPLYAAAVERLKAGGRLYPAYETPEELELKRKRQLARGWPPVYDRAALKLTAEERAKLETEGRKPHWRFRLEPRDVVWEDLVRGRQHVDAASLSDPVLVRADGTYLYTLPSVVDDIDLGITHVIRGEDHVANTAPQIQLFEALSAAPPAFGHHNLLVGAEGQALSKRDRALSIEALREEGIEALAVASYAATLGTSDPVAPHASLDELVPGFDFAKLSRAPARFDPNELRLLNAKLLHMLPFSAVADRLRAIGVTGGEDFWEAVRSNLAVLADAQPWWRVVEGPLEPLIEDRDLCTAAAGLLPAEPWDGTTWSAWSSAVKQATGAKGRALFSPLRLALTGREHGPELKHLLPLIGRARAAARLEGRVA